MQEEILSFIGKLVVYGGGSVAIAYGMFLFLGKTWIDNHFSKSLEKYKHEQNKELEETKYTINSLFSRVTKIHEKEFEVLPEAWSLLHNAVAALTRFTSVFKQYPNLDRMTNPELDEFLKNSFLLEFQKEELKSKERQLEYYQDRVFYKEMNEARNEIVEFHVYIQKNRIFLSLDLKGKFKEIDDIMWSAYVDMEVGGEAKDSKMKRDAWKKVKDDIEPVRTEIEELVQYRLHYDKVDLLISNKVLV